MENMIVELNKSGETYARVQLRRNLAGLLTLNVWTLPHVEEFMKNLGDGSTSDTVLGGRHWVNLNKREGDMPLPLMVYQLGVIIPSMSLSADKRSTITFNSVGVPIIGHDANGFEQLNMGFLRLVGTSSEGGVTFGIKGLNSTEQISRMREMIGEGLKRFYTSYMKPVNTTVMISAQTF